MNQRSSSFMDEEFLNKLANEDVKRRTKLIDALCSMMEYISFIPSFIYNAFWLFYLKSFIENLTEENGNLIACNGIITWANYVITWSTVSIWRALTFLCCAKICCGHENDLNVFCLLIQSIMGVIPAMVFIIKLPEVFEDYVQSKRLMSQSEAMFQCDTLTQALSGYYKLEYFYLISVTVAVCFVPIGAICMAVKEMWKSRGYAKHS